MHTWRRPGVNTAEITLNAPETEADSGQISIRAPQGVEVQNGFEGWALDATVPGYFVSAPMGAFIDANANRRYAVCVPDHYHAETPVEVTVRLNTAHPVMVDDLVIEAGEGSEATVILRYASDPGVKAEHTGRMRVMAQAGAKLQLIVVQTLSAGSVHTDAMEGIAEDGAQIDVIIAELGASRVFTSCNLTLAGVGSGTNLDVIYLGENERTLDITTRVEHRGKKTLSAIRAKGILLKGSRKVLRDTLDFVKGSSGSKGREEESVLLLSPDMRNISVPLLLCGEDDVEGEHAASSGRLDEKTLFYLMSRGIDEPGAKKLLAQAAFASIVEKIPDAVLREVILDTVTAAIDREGK